MTMPSKARRLGNAFRLGVIYATGATAAMDEAKWITVHPNGTGANAKGDPIKGRPLRSGAAIGDKLSALAEAMYAEGQRTDDIFGAVEHVPPKEIFKQVLGEDRKPGKMSAQMSAFWHKRGGAFLDAFFAGRGCKTFFSALRKEYSICR